MTAGRPDVGFRALLPPFADALVGVEFRRIERRDDERAIAPAAADLTVHAGADVEPRGGDDHRVDERPLDAVEHRRLVPLVDDADRHQHHPGADVERSIEQEVDVRLFELELAGFLEPLDERVFQLELADEADARRERVRDEQDEAMEVETGVRELRLVEVEVHVAGEVRPRSLAACRRGLRERGQRQQAEQQHLRDLDQQLRCGARADRDALIVLAADAHAVGGRVPRFDLDRLSRLEMVVLDEAQELLVLIDDARDGDGGLERAGEERLRVLRLHESLGIGNRIAVRIGLGPSEHLVHAIDQAIGDDVLEEFGFVVHLVPRVAHDPHEKELDEPMTPEDERGELLPGRGERDAGIRLVFHQPRLGQRLHHRRRRAGCDADGGGELAHGQKPLPSPSAGDARIDGLQVVLNGAGREHAYSGRD